MGCCFSCQPNFVRCPECQNTLMVSYPVTRCHQCDIVAKISKQSPNHDHTQLNGSPTRDSLFCIPLICLF